MADEVEQELEAVQAVYGSDCTVLQYLPPHLQVALKPRTADDISQQFVEAVLVIKASVQYPKEPPQLELKDTKGLDEERHTLLLTELRTQANELAFYPMLVAICEAATDKLTSMNQPEGHCCFCMLPLVIEDTESGLRPFMKLLSCFHCFHSDCFGRWWRWELRERNIQFTNSHLAVASERGQKDIRESSTSFVSHEHMLEKLLEELQLKCPVCRKAVRAEDVAHVWSFLSAESSVKEGQEQEMTEVPNFLLTEEEIARRNYFDEQFKAQQLRGGIIEHKKLEVIVPGMFLPPAAASSSTLPLKPSQEREEAMQDSSSIRSSDPTSSSSSETPDARSSSQGDGKVVTGQQPTEEVQEGPNIRSSTIRERKSERVRGEFSDDLRKEGRRSRQGRHAGGKQKHQWIRREREGGT